MGKDIEVLEQEIAAWKHTAEVYEKRCKNIMYCNRITLVASILTLLTALMTVVISLVK